MASATETKTTGIVLLLLTFYYNLKSVSANAKASKVISHDECYQKPLDSKTRTSTTTRFSRHLRLNPLSRKFYVRSCVKFTFANKIEAMYERSHVSVKVEPRSTSRLISTRVIGNQPLVVLARETALFWREKVIAVDILLRVLARMPLC